MVAVAAPAGAPRTPGRRGPLGLVVRPPADAAAPRDIDWSGWYLSDEQDMGEGFEQGEIIRVLLSAMHQLGRERGWSDWLCAGDQFFAWVEQHPLVRVSPDVYILDHPPPPPRPASWQTWLPGHRPPALAIEIASDDWREDYDESPAKYWQLGCPELVIFDPAAALGQVSRGERVALQRYHREADGAFLRTDAGPGPIYVERLGAWLVARPEGSVVRLRIARDAHGQDLVSTDAEAHQREADARRQTEARVRELEEKLRGLDTRRR